MGDIAYTMYEYLEVLFLNETQYEAKQLGTGDVDDLYTMVKEGEWTWEAFETYVKNYAGGVDMGEDAQEYGLVLNVHSFRSFLPAMDTTFTYREADNTVKLYETPNEKMINLFETTRELFLNRADVLCPNTNALEKDTQNPIFAAGRALFYGQQLGQAVSMREMQDRYGVLPFPKHDELQEDYYSTCSNEASAVMVPANVSESDYTLVGAIVEAMAMYGYQKIVPMYYDQVLSKQILSSENGQAMLKLIRESFMIDFSLAYTFAFGGTHPYTVYKQAFFATDTELTSYWTSKYNTLKGKLDTMYNSIQNIQ